MIGKIYTQTFEIEIVVDEVGLSVNEIEEIINEHLDLMHVRLLRAGSFRASRDLQKKGQNNDSKRQEK